MSGVYAIGERIITIINRRLTRFGRSRNTRLTNDKIHSKPISAINCSAHNTGKKTIVHGTVRMTSDANRMTTTPTTIVTWLSSTAFGGARSIGNMVLLNTDLLATTEMTP